MPWTEPTPTECPYGHRLGPNRVLVSWQPCDCPGAQSGEAPFRNGHRTQRCPPRAAPLTWPAWAVKNLAWSAGLGWAAAGLAVRPGTRRRLRARHSAVTAGSRDGQPRHTAAQR